MGKWQHLNKALTERRQANLYRQRLTLESPQGVHVRVDGTPYLSFSSNDYLGLASDPRLTEAATAAMQSFGVGGGASHLVCGHLQPHHDLEERLARFTGRSRALLFSTGYMANLGAISALTGRQDLILQDKLNHASLLDGARLSGSRLLRYRHNDVGALEERLQQAGDQRALVVTDGVFSMDGDIAELPAMSALCAEHDALLMVDDAHGVGVLGHRGSGCAEAFGLGQEQLPVLVGTLGKAFGTAGAFVAGSEEIIETIIQFARPYIYTTSMPPAIAAATLASIGIVEEESWRRDHLRALISHFRQGVSVLGYELMDSPTPIQPIVIGDAGKACALAQALRDKGILISAIRPPTVPENTSRLRVILSAEHTFDDVDRLLAALDSCQQAVA